MYWSSVVRRLTVVIAVAVIALLTPGPAPTALASTCASGWGSTAKVSSTVRSQQLSNVRSGRHACFDRLVIDLRGGASTGYDVRYVSAVYQEGSGDPVPLRGGAKLRIIVRAPAYNPVTGTPTYSPANPNELRNVSTYSTFRQIALAGSFEGQTTIGLGLRAQLPFRVFRIDDGASTRLIIDVAHRW